MSDKTNVKSAPLPSGDGIADPLPDLWAAAYGDLRQLAHSRLRAGAPLTLLDTSGLVGDTYRRLAGNKNLKIESRAHFLSYCARVMRSVIIDLVRERNAERRGGGEANLTLNTAVEFIEVEEPLQVDEALNDLAKVEPRLARVVEMRYFGGYSEEEIAEALDITVRTVQRDWQKARVLLLAMLSNRG